jgi:hypothetical protein
MFSQKLRKGELSERLSTLTNIIDGYTIFFVCIQDYIGIRDLKIFQEEFFQDN